MHSLVGLNCHMTTDLFVSQASFEQRTCFSNLDFNYFMGGSFSERRYWWAYSSKQTHISHGIILRHTANRRWSFHKNRDKDIKAVPLFSLHRSLQLASGKWKQPHPRPIQQQGSGLHPAILDTAALSWIYLKTIVGQLAWTFWAQADMVIDHGFTEMNYFQHGTYLIFGCELPFSQCQGMGPTQKGDLFQLLRSIPPSVQEGGGGRGYPTQQRL